MLDQSCGIFDNTFGTADELGGQVSAVVNSESIPAILNNGLPRAGNNIFDTIETILVPSGSVDDIPWTNRIVVNLGHNIISDSTMSFVDMLMAMQD